MNTLFPGKFCILVLCLSIGIHINALDCVLVSVVLLNVYCLQLSPFLEAS